MLKKFHIFWTDEGGQDLIEYSLLITFIAIAVCSLANFAAGEWFVFRESGR